MAVRSSAISIICIWIVLLMVLPHVGFANEISELKPAKDQPNVDPTSEFFTGGAFSKNTWFSWAGAVKTISSSLYEEGWRIRVLGGYGRYSFTTGGQPNSATPSLFELTPGYQFRSGRLISKIYMGLHVEQHTLSRPDANNDAAGLGVGFKVLSENWIDLPMNSFVSLDGSFSSLNNTYQAMVRTGMAKMMPKLSLGPEFQMVGNEEFYQFKLGLFARWKLANGAIEGSAGYAQDQDKVRSPYVAMSWLKHF